MCRNSNINSNSDNLVAVAIIIAELITRDASVLRHDCVMGSSDLVDEAHRCLETASEDGGCFAQLTWWAVSLALTQTGRLYR